MVIKILFHYRVPGFSSGFLGVDIFFVISGYLMTGILISKKHVEETFWKSILTFYANRARRILPALTFVCLAITSLFFTQFLPSEFTKLLKSNLSAIILLSNFFFSSQSSYFDSAAENNPMLHTWSLSVEWQFYFVFPVITYLVRKQTFLLQIILFSVLLVTSLVYCIWVSAQLTPSLRHTVLR